MAGGRKVEKAYRRLVAELADGKYPLNTPLPPGRDLSLRYGVSHPTLRITIKRLADEGRLESRHGSGVFVMPPQFSSGVSSRVVCFMTIADNGFLRDVQLSAINRSLVLNSYIQHSTEWDSRDEKKFLEFVKNERPLALFAFCSPLKPTNDGILREITANGTYLIHIEPFRANILPEQNYLMPDYKRAGHMAAMKLMMKGHGKIYQLARWDCPNPMDIIIERGINDALEEHSVKEEKALRLNKMKEVELRSDELRTMVSKMEEGAGIVSLSHEYMNYPYEMAIRLGRNDLGFVAVQAYGETGDIPFDSLKFDRRGIVERALDSNFNKEIKELVPPRWARGHTYQAKARLNSLEHPISNTQFSTDEGQK